VGSSVPIARPLRGSGVAVRASGRLTGRHDKRRNGQPDERDKDQEHVTNLCVRCLEGLVGLVASRALDSARPLV